ncbi:zinc ribbon domain-containing protein [Clostridium sp. BJN0013]|uniref:zinc ribbon domain-containing protein n=1 Tax=Clostridium sp. BJN0013 TaxID=3236840 RepID=UPI0034C6326F
MSYCSKCGKKFKEEDVYCSDCGSKRVDLDENIQIRNKNVQSIKVDINFKVVMDILINMFLKPISTAKRFINDSRKDAVIILTIFIAIMHGLLGMWRINQIVSSINYIVIKLAGKILKIINLIVPGEYSSSISSNDINEITIQLDRMKSIVKIPYGEIFLQNFILILVSILVVFILLYLANTLLSKSKPRVFQYYKTALIVTVPILYFEFFSILFSYLSFNIGLAIALFGFIVSLVCFVMIIKESLVIPENYTLFVVSFIDLVTIIVLIVWFQKCMPSVISNIMSSIINDIKSLNL